jgi:hypothetical protein
MHEKGFVCLCWPGHRLLQHKRYLEVMFSPANAPPITGKKKQGEQNSEANRNEGNPR